ncbi:MFS transporter [Nocardiopsis potens]|uniref:MFS transporter n=1 Tax=Nocardiopsis potens TaxID=1246458 RepID=UPI000361A796|nr:MFS transporter [Nocardiopsis potens]
MPAADPSTAPWRRRRWALASASLGAVVVTLDVSVVNVAADALDRDLGAGMAALEWVVNGYTLTFAAFLLSAGTLADRFGPGRVFEAGFALFAAASLAAAAATGPGALIAARAVQGVGAALLLPSSLALVNRAFPEPAARARAVGMWASGGSLALALGPLFGGVLIEQAGWRSVFLINLPIAAVGIALARFGAGEAARAAGRAPRAFDLPGQLLAVLFLSALTAGLVEANTLGWSAPVVWALLAAAALGLAGFLLVERAAAEPMLPPALFRGRAFTSAVLIGALLNFSFYGLVFVLSLFFQKSWGYSPVEAGAALLPATAAILAANLLSSRAAARFGLRAVLVAGGAAAAAGFWAMVPAVHSASHPALAVPFLLVGGGLGLVVPAVTNAVLAAVEPGAAGLASGAFNAARQVGVVLGIAVMGLVVGEASPGALAAGLPLALALAGAVQLASALLGLLAAGRRAAPPAPAGRPPAEAVRRP